MPIQVLITRPRLQSTGFAVALQAAGFVPVHFPVIEIRPMEDNNRLDLALAQLAAYDWVIFTSVNAVEVVFQRGFSFPGADTCVPGPRVAAIGPKTAAALQARGVQPDFTPAEYVAEAILPGLGDLNGRRVLLPRAEIARQALPEGIRAAGGLADEIAVYHTLPAEPDRAGLACLRAGVQWITFTSPSTVQNFVEIVRAHGLNPLALPGGPRIACIGPVTARTAQEEGLSVGITAAEYTSEGLIAALCQTTPPQRNIPDA